MTTFHFEATVIPWRGPAPFFFSPVPQAVAEEISRLSKLLSYGWGMIPVDVTIGDGEFYTALLRKDGTYLVPLKDAMRKKVGVTAGDVVSITMTLRPPKS
ncbi:DUF1905 domain-containing protein [Rhizobiales bacterium RZME27]|uniref:DUF1905 domain-containing protein n=1 Tax=Endobacterium cereale TaxID=2663029 RepID=A0A6A8AFA2_9HYPH|nr:DUF1905 domain-containing protein [Endobacterium cereale]MQY49782.1 DUF1905 domain-containing protein [Endobacterium cereale]